MNMTMGYGHQENCLLNTPNVFIFGKAIFELPVQNLVIPCVTFNYAKGYFKTLEKKKKKGPNLSV